MKWSNHDPYTISMAKYTLLLKQLHDTEKEPNSEFKIFSFDYDFYTDDEQTKADFEKLFIETYYFEEINAETVARWKYNLKARLDIIAPYYKKLYETELRTKDLDFMINKDYVEEIKNTSEQTNTNDYTNTLNDKNSLSSSIKNEGYNNFSDTPITKVDDIDKYLSSQDKTVNNSDTKSSTTTDSTNTSKTTGTNKTANTQLLKGKGNIGVTSSADLLKGWREILIDINRMIIEDLHDMFLNIY